MSHCRLTVTVERKPDGWNAACACGATSGTHQLLSRALAFPQTGRAGREGEARKARPTKITGWGRGRVNDVDPVVVDRLIHGEPPPGPPRPSSGGSSAGDGMKVLLLALLATSCATPLPASDPGPSSAGIGKQDSQLPAKTRPRPPHFRVSRALDRPALDIWDRLAACESSGDWKADTGNGYYGGLQADLTFWRNYGGARFASRPDLASRSQQITVAQRGLASQGWGAWPVCSVRVGLR